MTGRAFSAGTLLLFACAACDSGDKGASDTSSAWFTFSRSDQGSLSVGENDKRQYEFISSNKKAAFQGTFDAATVSELEELLDEDVLGTYYGQSADPDDEVCYGGAGFTLTTTRGTGCWVYADVKDQTTRAALDTLIEVFSAAKREAESK